MPVIWDSGALLFIYYFFLWPHWIFVATHGLSVAAERGLLSSCGVWASHCGGFFCCGARALGHAGFSSQ